jgi:hypothetical protein
MRSNDVKNIPASLGVMSEFCFAVDLFLRIAWGGDAYDFVMRYPVDDAWTNTRIYFWLANYYGI